MGRIFDFRRRGGTLVFVSHDPNAVERVCDRAVLVDGGVVVADGAPHDVMAQYHRLLAQTTDGVGARIEVDDAPDEEEVPDEPNAPSDLGGWGSGELTITGVSLFTGTERVQSVVSGDELRIVIRLTAKHPVHDPVVGISIVGDDGTALFGTNTEIDHVSLGDIGSVAEVTYTIPSVPFHAGGFAVTVATHSEDVRVMYHWIDRAAEFTVFPRRSGVGLVEVSGAWGVA